MPWGSASSYSQQSTGNCTDNVHGSSASSTHPHLFHHHTTETTPMSHLRGIAYNTPYPPCGLPVPPTSYIDTPSQDLHRDPSSSHTSYPILGGGPSNYFDNTTAPVGVDSFRKRKSTDDPAESRPVTRQRETTAPPTIVQSQVYALATDSQVTSEASDIRAQTSSTGTDIPSQHPGAGPSSIQPTTTLSSHKSHLSLTYSDAKETRPNDSATDLWHFVFGSRQQDEPEDLDSVSHETRFASKPKTNMYPYIGCRICKGNGKWTMWKNSNGCNKHIRRHLVNKHEKQYVVGVREKGLKHADIIAPCPSREKSKDVDRSPIEPCTAAGFKRRLTQWALKSGQPLHIVESPEFQDLIHYATGGCVDHKVLSGTTLEETIAQDASRLNDKLVDGLAHSLGGITATYDRWVDGDLGGFSAVTLHWCAESSAGDLIIKSELVALDYDHQDVYESLEDGFLRDFRRNSLGSMVVNKVKSLSQRSPYTLLFLVGMKEDNYLCLTLELDLIIQGLLSQHNIRISNQPTARVFTVGNIIDHSRNVVRRCQTLTQPPTNQPLQKLAVALSQDYKTNWGSLLFMIERLLEMRETISTLYDDDVSSLSESEWSILHDTRDLLDILRQAKLSLDFGHPGAMSHTILTYRNLSNRLREFQHKTPSLEDCAKCLVQISEGSWEMWDDSLFALIVNPAIKFSHFTEANDLDEIKTRFIDLMVEKYSDFIAKQRIESPETSESHSTTDESESDYGPLVEAELSRYLDAGLEVQTPRFSLLSFWKASKTTYPNIYAIALDYLPLQPATVSCKRIFSTSEHTDALRDGRISFGTFATLQRLKFHDGKTCLHDTVWKHLNVEDALRPSYPSKTYTVASLLNGIAKAEDRRDSDDTSD